METEPASSQRNQQGYAPGQMQCPRCGLYNPEPRVRFVNPRTGASTSYLGPHGCLISLVVFFAIYMGGYEILNLLYEILQPGEFSTLWAIAAWIFPFGVGPLVALIAALFAIPLYRAWRWRSLSKTHIVVGRFVCQHCKNEWEPPAKKLP